FPGSQVDQIDCGINGCSKAGDHGGGIGNPLAWFRTVAGPWTNTCRVFLIGHKASPGFTPRQDFGQQTKALDAIQDEPLRLPERASVRMPIPLAVRSAACVPTRRRNPYRMNGIPRMMFSVSAI